MSVFSFFLLFFSSFFFSSVVTLFSESGSKRPITLDPFLDSVGHFKQLLRNKFFDPSTPSMRKGDDGEKKREKKEKKEKKIKMFLVATNVVASRPPNGDRLQRRPLVPKNGKWKIMVKLAVH